MILLFFLVIVFIAIIGFVVIKTFDDSGDLETIYFCFITLFGVIAISLFVSYKGNEYYCEKKATTQGLEYRYGWEGCFVKEREGNYIDYDKYRVLK